jgi:hypothetical protein
MKTLQVFGFALAVFAVSSAWLLLGGLPALASGSQAGAVGLWLMFVSAPLSGLAGLLLLPTTVALAWPNLRRRFGIRGFWFTLWCVNAAMLLGTLAFGAWVAWVVMAGNPPVRP